MQMIRWMCGVSMKDRKTSKELRRMVGVGSITTVIRSGMLRCMEYNVKVRRPVGRPRRAWIVCFEIGLDFHFITFPLQEC